ncbi:MAG: hypothetical protein II086_05270 [Ruminococcus sp.]|nr:hypothetical protein [Ruminococcus sp.]
MRKATVTVSYDEKKLDALRKYLEKKGIDFEDEMVKSIDTLYSKNVPSAVKEYLDMKSEPSNLKRQEVKNSG